jgi:hypothetical protein
LNISLLPLDSRPCNTLFPLKLGRIAGENLNLPDRGFMDYFTRPAWFPYIDEWLLEFVAKSDYFILSLDMLAYGGLIASRQAAAAEACPRLEIIRKMKALNPALRIFAFGIIMRTSITTVDKKSRHYWGLINEYSRLKGLGDPGFAELERRIPQELLVSFLSLRERNHQVNCRAVDLLNEGTIDCLTLLQEDTSTGGLQAGEQKILAERINSSVSDRAFIHNGADEGAMVLLARVLNAENPPVVHWEFLDPAGETMTAAYEDRPFIKNIESQTRACGMIAGSTESPVELLILPSKGERQRDSQAQNDGADYSGAELEEMAGKIEGRLDAGKAVGLLDAAYANGGHGAFMDLLRKKSRLGLPVEAGDRNFPRKKLCAYAAWNTASNSLGTVLCQISAFCRGMRMNLPSGGNDIFTLERFLDDCLYQSVIRPRIQQELGEEGLNVLNIGGAKAGVEKRIYEELRTLAPNLNFSFSLPWPRTFEGNIEINPESVPARRPGT